MSNTHRFKPLITIECIKRSFLWRDSGLYLGRGALDISTDDQARQGLCVGKYFLPADTIVHCGAGRHDQAKKEHFVVITCIPLDGDVNLVLRIGVLVGCNRDAATLIGFCSAKCGVQVSIPHFVFITPCACTRTKGEQCYVCTTQQKVLSQGTQPAR